MREFRDENQDGLVSGVLFNTWQDPTCRWPTRGCFLGACSWGCCFDFKVVNIRSSCRFRLMISPLTLLEAISKAVVVLRYLEKR